MSDDLLATVKAKLDGSAGLLNRWDSEEVAALVARVEQAEADRDIFMASNAALTTEVLQMRDALAAERTANTANITELHRASADMTTLRERHAELAPHLDHLCAMYAAGAPRPGGQQVQPPAEAVSQPTLRRLVRPIVEAWLASSAKQGLEANDE